MLECVYKNKVKERSTNSIMIISNSNVATNGSLMHELKLKVFMMILAKRKKCLSSVIILVHQNITIIQIHQLLTKLKMKWLVLLLKSLVDKSQKCTRFY